MFAVVPLGVEGGEVRFPVVGLAILVTCAVIFGATWLAEPDPLGTAPEQTEPVFEYWSKRPYLELPEAFTRRFVGTPGRAAMERVRSHWSKESQPPDARLVIEEQNELDVMATEAVAAAPEPLFRRLALNPSRGWAQPGWVTHLFVHAGWMHLIGNMLFLYAVSLLLEDAWGRGRFLAFYLVGGLVSGAAEFLMNRGSTMVLVGASGAVSACIGAAMVRFARRRMRVGYLLFLGILFRTGTFSMPVWLWGVFKAGNEVMDLATGSAPGVAVLAHVVGIGFGVGVALVMRLAGLDKELVATDEASSSLVMSYSSDVEEAQRLLAQGALVGARRYFQQARATSGTDVDALWGLFELEVRERRPAAAGAHLERIVQVLLKQEQTERARDFFVSGWRSVRPSDLRPGLALVAAKALGPLLPSDVALEVWTRASEVGGVSSALPTMKALELAVSAEDAPLARRLLHQLEGLGPLAPEVEGRKDAARARLEQVVHEEPDLRALHHQPPLATPRQRFEASVTSARREGLSLALRSGASRVLPLSEVKAVAAGYVAAAEQRRVLVVFLVLDWGGAGRPAVLVKLDSDTGGVDRLRPGVTARAAWLQFLPWLVDQARSVALPSREHLATGELPFCADVSTLEEALFSPLS